MTQLAVLIIFAAIGIINALVKKGAAEQKRRPGGGTFPSTPQNNLPGSRPSMQAPQDAEDARLRQFMEALGVPATTTPPRQIVRQQQPAPRVQSPVRKVIPRQVVPRQVAVRRVPTPPPLMSPAPAYQMEAMGAQSAAKTEADVAASSVAELAGMPSEAGLQKSPAVDFRSLLRSPSSIRTAIALREILGPPRGLQPFEGAYNLR